MKTYTVVGLYNDTGRKYVSWFDAAYWDDAVQQAHEDVDYHGDWALVACFDGKHVPLDDAVSIEWIPSGSAPSGEPQDV